MDSIAYKINNLMNFNAGFSDKKRIFFIFILTCKL